MVVNSPVDVVGLNVPLHEAPTVLLGPDVDVGGGKRTQVNGLDGSVEDTLTEVGVTDDGFVSEMCDVSYARTPAFSSAR